MSAIQKIERTLNSRVGKAIFTYDMIGPNDRVMVGFSGGKDSWALLFTLKRLADKAPINFGVVPVHVDPGFPDHDIGPMVKFLEHHGFELEVLKTGIYDLIPKKVSPKDNPCYFCSRMRRGTLYGRAKKGDFTKIALGHNQEDVMETFFMNLFYNGRLRAMGPNFVTDDGAHTVIRPLTFTEEELIIRYAGLMKFPLMDDCPFKREGSSNRKEMRKLIEDMKKKYPKSKKSIMRALSNVDPTHLLDKRLYRKESGSMGKRGEGVKGGKRGGGER